MNRGFIKINGLQGGDGRRVVRVRVGVNICCEECLVEYLFVCNTMKWSDRNVFFEESVPQIIASRSIGCSVCVLRGVKRFAPASVCRWFTVYFLYVLSCSCLLSLGQCPARHEFSSDFDLLLFGSLAVVMRCVPQFMLEASFRHADVYLLLQGSCGIFPSRSASICRRLVSTRGKSLCRTVVLCVVCCVSLETFQVFCVCSACAQVSRTHGFHV